MRNIRITADGTGLKGIKIVDTETGQHIEGLSKVEIDIPGKTGEVTARLTFFNAELDIVAQVDEPPNG